MIVLGAGIFQGDELTGFPLPPAWRKATRNMVMATASIERALASLTGLQVAGNPEVALVLGSASGELETTADFLSTWAKSKMARPILFQNSLHNATTGFAAIHFKIMGPVFTMSSFATAPQEGVEMAEMLLKENSAKVCIVTMVEGHKALAERIGEENVREGACSLVLTSAEYAQEQRFVARAELPQNLASFNYTPEPQTKPLLSIARSGFFKFALGASS
jgi:hypothetical protein